MKAIAEKKFVYYTLSFCHFRRIILVSCIYVSDSRHSKFTTKSFANQLAQSNALNTRIPLWISMLTRFYMPSRIYYKHIQSSDWTRPYLLHYSHVHTRVAPLKNHTYRHFVCKHTYIYTYKSKNFSLFQFNGIIIFYCYRR